MIRISIIDISIDRLCIFLIYPSVVGGSAEAVTTGRLGRSRLGLRKCETMSMGTGKMMVEFFSADMVLRVCK